MGDRRMSSTAREHAGYEFRGVQAECGCRQGGRDWDGDSRQELRFRVEWRGLDLRGRLDGGANTKVCRTQVDQATGASIATAGEVTLPLPLHHACIATRLWEDETPNWTRELRGHRRDVEQHSPPSRTRWCSIPPCPLSLRSHTNTLTLPFPPHSTHPDDHEGATQDAHSL
eukprot:scaffold908_cov98-Isochrysis_galbana.AAC.3